MLHSGPGPLWFRGSNLASSGVKRVPLRAFAKHFDVAWPWVQGDIWNELTGDIGIKLTGDMD